MSLTVEVISAGESIASRNSVAGNAPRNLMHESSELGRRKELRSHSTGLSEHPIPWLPTA